MRWDPAKSERLKRERGVSFEEIVQAEIVGMLEHPGRPGQKLLLFRYHGYIWLAPFVYNGDFMFLKTLYPSRKYTKLIGGGNSNETV